MNIIVMSDTHGCRRRIQTLKGIIDESDLLIHLGDGYGDVRAFRNKLQVAGNCDVAVGDREIVTELDGIKVLIAHGDRYGVKQTLTRLAERAKDVGAAYAFYGHTHIPAIDKIDGVTLINPGSLSDYAEPSYAYVSTVQGKIIVKIVKISF